MTSEMTLPIDDVDSRSLEPDAARRRLNVFVGRWTTEGRQYDGPFGPDAKISAVETYEWLTGELFLVHRFEGRVGEDVAACIEIIAHDSQRQSYPIHTFYNNGLASEWRLRERDGTWTLTGESQMQGKALKVRRTTAFSDAGRGMSSKWEQSGDDGSHWQTFWDIKATKAQ